MEMFESTARNFEEAPLGGAIGREGRGLAECETDAKGVE